MEEREQCQDHKGRRGPSGLTLGQWGHEEGAEQPQVGIWFRRANKQHTGASAGRGRAGGARGGWRCLHDPRVWASGTPIVHRQALTCVSVLVHLHICPSMLCPLRGPGSGDPETIPPVPGHSHTRTTPRVPGKTKVANGFVVCFRNEKPIQTNLRPFTSAAEHPATALLPNSEPFTSLWPLTLP